MGKVVGIDLGTTNSVIAVLEGGKPQVIVNAEGSRLTPSVVGFSKSNERLIGEIAKRQAVSNPDRTISSIKRYMGSDHKVKIDDKNYTPQEISAMILQKLKTDAESYLGEKITQAVITVPAYFNDSQRQATKDAGTIANLEVLRIINEPTASSLAYGLDKAEDSQTILVYDLGGGTFDVSILEIGGGVFQVKSTSGNTHLGGDDWDARIIDYLVDQFQKENNIDLMKDKMALQRLKEAAEKAKIELSALYVTNINLPFISADQSGPKHLDVKLTRATFQELTCDLVDKTMGPLKQALEDASLKPSDMDKILLVGGATRMPAIQDLIKQVFGREAHKEINPDECVALGAAIQAGVLAGEVKDIVLIDVTPLSLGLETLGGVFTRLIERNTAIPTAKSQLFTTAADGQSTVEIHVLQGEREMAEFNKSLGRFQLNDIPPAPRGIPQIEVTFDIDSNGIVNVSAKDKGTGKEQKITINTPTNLVKEQVEKMVKEAESYAQEDKKRRESVEIRNNADMLIYRAQKTVKDYRDVDPDTAKNVEEEIEKLKKTLQEGKTEQIKTDAETLTEALYKFSTAIYNRPQPTPSEETQTEEIKEKEAKKTEETKEEVVDADYKVEEGCASK